MTMKRLIALMFLTGCTVQVKPDPILEQKLNQHAAVITAITQYIGELQARGVLPKPEVKEQP